jgi:hypothetical protein
MKRMSDKRLAIYNSGRYHFTSEKFSAGLELLEAMNTERALLNEAEKLMIEVAARLSTAAMGQSNNELAGDMNAWMEKLE